MALKNKKTKRLPPRRKVGVATRGMELPAAGMYEVANSLFAKLPIYAAASGDAAYFLDPNIKASKPQALVKKDVIKMRFTPADCVTDSQFAKDGDDAYTSGIRVAWLAPLNLHFNASGQIPEANEGDSRGTFVDIGKCVFHFKNVLRQPIRIVFNSPRGRITDPGQPYVRRFKKEVVIPANAQRTFRVTWGDHANIYTPLVINVPLDSSLARKYPCFVVADLLVVLPDFNLESGLALEKQSTMTALELTVQQHYVSTLHYAGTGSIVERDAFVIVKNNTRAGMLNEAFIDATNLSLPQPLTLTSVGTREVLMTGSKPFRVNLADNTRFTISGVSGYFTVEKGVAFIENEHGFALEPANRYIPSGAILSVVGGHLEIDFKSVIGFLTTLTEAVRIISLLF